MPTTWHPTQLLQSETPPSNPFAIIVANVHINTKVYSVISKHASLIVLADGAGNHFYDQYLRRSKVNVITDAVARESSSDVRLPDAVVGDLDSLEPQISQNLSSRGIEIHKDPDQYSTDIEKCLKWVQARCESSSSSSQEVTTTMRCPPLDIIIMGNLSGRVDQAMSSLHQMYIFSRDQPQQSEHIHQDQSDGCDRDERKSRYYFLSDQSLTFILEPGVNQIQFPRGSVLKTRSTKDTSNPEPALDHQEQDSSGLQNSISDSAIGTRIIALFTENIGILPLAGPCEISTKGLEWDVKSWPTKFGSSAMSTSNHIRSHDVEIKVSPFHRRTSEQANANEMGDEMMGPLFTVELAPNLCS